MTARLCGLLAFLIALPAAAADSDPLLRHGLVLPARPVVAHTVNVCREREIEGCFGSVAAALAQAPRAGLRVLVHCGRYRGDHADLSGFSDLVLEGVPCADGRLPVLDAAGESLHRLGAFPWVGPVRNLWVEGLEFRGNHVAGTGTAIHVAGGGDVVFKNVVMTDNDTGILIAPGFGGAVYVVDSVFRDNGYGIPAGNHHIHASCRTDCLLVVLDSYFGKLLQGGNHIRAHGKLVAVGNMFIDEPDAQAAQIVDAMRGACRILTAAAPPPCLVAENYMLKNQTARNGTFVKVGDTADGGDRPVGMTIRDNVAIALRGGAVLVGNAPRNTRVAVRGNLMVVVDRGRCAGAGVDCLVAVRDPGTVLEGNVVSGDPADAPVVVDRRLPD